MAGLPLLKLEEQTTCSVCLSSYSDPKVLQCLHTYCRGCLESLLTKGLKEHVDRPLQIIICPTCREVTPVPASGVAGLKTDFKIPSLIELRETIAAQPVPNRGGKGEDTTLPQADPRDVRREGTEVSETGFGASPTSKRIVHACPEHENEELEYYCEICEEVMCSKCFIKKHNGHEYSNVTEISPLHRKELASLLKQVEANLASTEEVLTKVGTRGDKISRHKVSIETEVDEAISELHEAVERRKQELIKQLDGITWEKMKALVREKNKKREVRLELRGSVDEAKEALKQDRDADMGLVNQLKDINRKFADKEDLLKIYTEADMEFTMSPELTKNCKHFGQILTPECLDPLMCTASGRGLEVAEVDETTAVSLCIKNHKNEPYDQPVNQLECELVMDEAGFKLKCDIESRQQNLFKITYKPTHRGIHQLHIRVNGQHIKGSPFPVLVKRSVEKLHTPVSVIKDVATPWGVAISKDGKVVVVTECNQGRVSIFNDRGEKLRSFGTLGSGPGELKNARGVALDDDQNVYVADSGNYRLQKFTLEGKHLACVGTRGNKPTEFSHPKGVAFNPVNKKLYITDLTRFKIYDTNFGFSGSFGGRGNGPGQFAIAVGVACDSTGNVYITDRHNNSIQVFSAGGDFLRMFQGGESATTISPKGFLRGLLGGKAPAIIGVPFGVAINDSGRVFVTEDGNHRVSVLAHDGSHVTSFGSEGAWVGEFKHPKAIAVSPAGLIYVCDFENNRVQVY